MEVSGNMKKVGDNRVKVGEKKMKKMKRILALFVCLCMLMTITVSPAAYYPTVSTIAYADDGDGGDDGARAFLARTIKGLSFHRLLFL